MDRRLYCCTRTQQITKKQNEVSIFVKDDHSFMLVEKFIPNIPSKKIDAGSVGFTSPSNIALVKYWGKKPHQIPSNPSISFTLNNCKTETVLQFSPNTTDGFSFEVYLDEQKQPDFRPKIEHFFQRIFPYAPFLKHYHFDIKTSNTFPHSSGIASSASGMSALAMCIVALEEQLYSGLDANYLKRKASFLARLGSGSACRSIEGGLVVWGEHNTILGSSDLEGVPYPFEVHDVFKNYQDAILLVDKGEKQVSSTIGHNLMHNHPYAPSRFEQAHRHLDQLVPILKSGDLEGFISIIEKEALTLHAMMMSSDPYFILMKPNTLEIINLLWTYRKRTKIPVCFTLDAGANVHVLYPKKHAIEVELFVKNKLSAYCQNNQYILDNVGEGAERIKI